MIRMLCPAVRRPRMTFLHRPGFSYAEGGCGFVHMMRREPHAAAPCDRDNLPLSA